MACQTLVSLEAPFWVKERPMLLPRPLNATAASLLGFLHDGPMAGYDLVASAQQRIGDFWSLTQSQVYRELSTMAGAGLVDEGERGRRDRRPYTITRAGRQAFAEWVQRVPGAETIRFPLLLTLVFAQHVPPERTAEFLALHRAAHAERLAAYEAQRASIPAEATVGDPYATATLDFGIAYERSVLTWFDQLLIITGDPRGVDEADAGHGAT